ncbi:MAG TPA: hypothetical protein V6D06_18510 [Trichocoleus sp.]
MSAALKPSPSGRRRPDSSWQGSRAKAGTSAWLGTVSTQSRHLEALPSASRWTGRTRFLAAVNTGVSVLSGLLVTTVLGGYGYTVYVDRQLDQSSARLETLQRSEQQLTTVNEVLKNHMAKQAETSGTGLQPPQPTNVIFLKPAQRRIASQPGQPAPVARPSQPLPPLGY